MLLRTIRPFFLAILFVMALACMANASILEYSNALTLNGSDATVLFTIDTTQGTATDPSMHNGLDAVVNGYNAYDSVFTISVTIGGTTYSNDFFSWTSAYPSVTVNSDLSINAIDFWVSDGTDVFVIETAVTGTTLSALAYSDFDRNGNGTVDSSDFDMDNDGDIDSDAIGSIIQNESWASATIDQGDWTTSEVPEPATLSLFGLGLFGWAWVIRRRSLK
nr:PEP-CTERM sorting domain-containing protein [uncultured Desulfobacter sp.]